MRTSLLELLKCPACGSRVFTCQVTEENDLEIREGIVLCGDCQIEYPMIKGILDMRPGEDQINIERAEGWKRIATPGHQDMTDQDLLDFSHGRNAPNGHAYHFSFGGFLNQDRIISEMGDITGKRLIDIGSGRCTTTNRLSQMGAYCVAIDLATTKYVGLESADVYIYHSGVYFERVLTDMNQLPFQQEFDLVFANDSVHHSFDLAATFEGFARVLAPQGQVFLAEPAGSFLNLFGANLTLEEREAGEHIYSLWDYMRAASRVRFHYTILYPPGLSRRLNALASGAAMLPAPSNCRQGIKYHFVRTSLSFWRFRLVRYLLERILFWPALFLFGQVLLMKAQKRG